MWIFVYGSLMWDGWQKEFDCFGKHIADLPKYKRTLTKNSIVNWGTYEFPCPTLNIIPDDNEICTGIAFEFSNHEKEKVFGYLQKREGRDFELEELEINIRDIKVTAFSPIYKGKNYLEDMSNQEMAKLILIAEGQEGRCVDYLQNLIKKLETIRINDEALSSVWKEIQRLRK